MGELEAGHLRRFELSLMLDEPYQHFHYSGRADLLAVDLRLRALLHLENRTRFPDIQEFLGSWNAKRAYLADDLRRRVGVRSWTSVTHVIVALWSAEALHAIRMHRATFMAAAPDDSSAFNAWWSGAPARSGLTSSLIVLDPALPDRSRRRTWVDLSTALSSSTDARFHGYADTLLALRQSGRA
jgi:hypothetical protein